MSSLQAAPIRERSKSRSGSQAFIAALAVSVALLAVVASSASAELPTVSPGLRHTCAVTSTGQGLCWGANEYGQSNVPAGHTWKYIGAGGSTFSCGLTTDSEYLCWGYSAYLGGGGALNPAPASSPWSTLAVGDSRKCASSPTGTGYCWGIDPFNVNTLPTGQSWAYVSPGSTGTCGLTTAGAIYCVGIEGVPSGKTWASLSSGYSSACGVTTDGEGFCWGENYFGSATVPAGHTWASIKAGTWFTCGVTTSGEGLCWGFDFHEELNVPTGKLWSSISPGVSRDGSATGISTRACGVTVSGEVLCWGWEGNEGATNVSGANVVPAGYFTDETAPASPTIFNAPVGATQERSATFGVRGEEGATTTCSLDGGAYVECPLFVAYSDLADGQHTLRVIATDPTGNASEPASASWTVDTAAPASPELAELTGAPGDYDQQASISITAEDGASLTCSVDGGEPAPCSSPWTPGSLSNGSHSLSVIATDQAGNASAPGTLTWITNGPTFSAQPSSLTMSSSATLSFSGDDAVGYLCRLDDGETSECSSPLVINGLSDGSHTLTVRSIFASGRASTPTSVTWEVNTVVPDAPVIGGKPDNPTKSRNASLTVTGPDSTTLTCSFDGGDFEPCLDPVEKTGLGDGEHILVARATAASGTYSEAEARWTVDTHAAAPVFSSTPEAVIVGDYVLFAIEISEPSVLYCSKDGADFTQCQRLTYASNLTPGKHTFASYAVDAAGNRSATIEYTWAVADHVLPYASHLQVGITTGGKTSCSLTSDYSANCWGDNSFGQADVPQGQIAWARISPGTDHSCGVSLNGTGYCWGANDVGQSDVPQDKVWYSISAGNKLSCGVTYIGEALCWGSNYAGGATVPAGHSWDSISAGTAYHACGVTQDDQALCWGYGSSWGPGSKTDVPAGHSWKSVTAGWMNSCGVTTDSQLLCWGNSAFGPPNVPAGKSWTSVALGKFTACGITTAGEGLCWGEDPAENAIPAGGTWSKINSGDSYACGIRTDGTGACWGDNSSGQLVIPVGQFGVENPSVPTVTGHPTSESTSTDAEISFTGDSGNSFSCSVDGGDYSGCTSPLQLNSLTLGSHTVLVKSSDSVGRTSDAATVSWTVVEPVVDTTAPDAPTIETRPAAVSNSASATIEFSGEADATFTCSVDGGSYAACASPKSLDGLSDGDHGLSVKATDLAGNTGAAATVSWTVDTTAPDAPTVTSRPGTLVSSATASIAFTAEAGATATCSVDGGTFASCESPLALAGLSDGSHSVVIKATDAAGNVSAGSTVSWTVDRTAPSAPNVTSRPATFSSSATASISFSAEVGAALRCSVDGGAFSPCTSPLSLSGLRDGLHSVVIRAIDAVGNISTGTTVSWTVDTVAPAKPIIDSAPAARKNVTTASITFRSLTDPTFRCSLDGALATACSSPKTYTGLREGSHSVVISHSDAAGNTSSTSVTWLVDLTAPSLTTLKTGKVVRTSTKSTIPLSTKADASTVAKVEYRTLSATPTATQTPAAARVVAFTNPLVVKSSSKVYWVRLQDGAGNWSKWYATS